MLIDHFVEITKLTYAHRNERDRPYSNADTLAILDALLQLLNHAADQDRDMRDLKAAARKGEPHAD